MSKLMNNQKLHRKKNRQLWVANWTTFTIKQALLFNLLSVVLAFSRDAFVMIDNELSLTTNHKKKEWITTTSNWTQCSMVHCSVLAVKSAFKESKRDALRLLSANFYTVSLSLWIKSCSVTTQNKSYWAVLSCDTVYYAVQRGSNFNFGSVDTILQWNHSNESYWAVLSCG